MFEINLTLWNSNTKINETEEVISKKYGKTITWYIEKASKWFLLKKN